MPSQSNELKNTSYELFIAALSVLSVFNLFLIGLAKDPVMDETVVLMDVFLTLIFLADFVYRLATAESRSHYLLRQYGWADGLASLPLPQAKLLRLFRIARAGRLMRELGARKMLHQLVSDRAGSALLTVLLCLILLLEFGSLLVIKAEIRDPDANIASASDAVWWVYVTMTTVGYGDRYPVTQAGRAVGMLVMAAGVGLFGVLTGFLANLFLAPPAAEETPEQPAPSPPAEVPSAAAPSTAVPSAESPATLALLQEHVREQRAQNAILLERLEALERAIRAKPPSG